MTSHVRTGALIKLSRVHSLVDLCTGADDTETCFQWFWKEVQWLEDHPRHATSLLLMTNPYWASNFDAFEQFGDALTQALQSATESKVEGLGFEGQIQLVFFHPQYVFRIDPCGNQPVSSVTRRGYGTRRVDGVESTRHRADQLRGRRVDDEAPKAVHTMAA